MKPLEANYRIFSIFCICPPDGPPNNFTKFRNAFTLIFGFVITFLGSIASFVYIKNNVHTDLTGSIFALLHSSAIIVGSYTFVRAFLLRMDITETFDGFQRFYDLSKVSF